MTRISRLTTTLKNNQTLLSSVLLLTLVPMIIYHFSVFEHETDIQLNFIGLGGTFCGVTARYDGPYVMGANETLISGDFEGRLEFGEFEGYLEGVFVGEVNSTFTGDMSESIDSSGGSGVSLLGYFMGRLNGRLRESNPMPVVFALSILILYGVWTLFGGPKTFKKRVGQILCLFTFATAVGLGTDLWILEVTSFSSSFFLPEIRNSFLFISIRLVVLAIFIALAAILWRLYLRLERKNIQKSEEWMLPWVHLIAVAVLILAGLIEARYVLPLLVEAPSSLVEMTPMVTLIFANFTSVILRSWSAVVTATFILLVFWTISNLLAGFPKKTEFLAELEAQVRAEKGSEFDALQRKYSHAVVPFMLIGTILVLVQNAMPEAVQAFVFGELYGFSLATILYVAGLLFLGGNMLYILANDFKARVAIIGTPERCQQLFRDLRKHHFYDSLIFTIILLSILLVISAFGYGMVQPLFSGFGGAYESFVEGWPQGIGLIGSFIISAIIAFWIYAFVPFYIYSHGWKPLQVAIVTFFGSFAIQELVEFLVPFAISGLPVSFLGALISFAIAYTLTNRLETFVKSKFTKRRKTP